MSWTIREGCGLCDSLVACCGFSLLERCLGSLASRSDELSSPCDDDDDGSFLFRLDFFLRDFLSCASSAALEPPRIVESHSNGGSIGDGLAEVSVACDR